MDIERSIFFSNKHNTRSALSSERLRGVFKQATLENFASCVRSKILRFDSVEDSIHAVVFAAYLRGCSNLLVITTQKTYAGKLFSFKEIHE